MSETATPPPVTLREAAGFSKALWLSMPRTEAFGHARKGKTKGNSWTPSKSKADKGKKKQGKQQS